MHKYFFPALFFCLVASSQLNAQLNQSALEKIDSLLSLIDSAEKFEPIDASAIAQAKSRLEKSMAELDRQLTNQGAENSKAWKSYLQWDLLTEQVNSETPKRTELNKVVRKFQMNHPGLELEVFTDVRGAITEYANLSYFGAENIGKRIYDSRLNLLKTNLEKLKTEYNDRTVGLIGEAITDLENSRQCPTLVKAIRKAFAKPNLHLQISEKLAKAIVNKQKTSDTRTVREEILGVLQRGTAHTTATFDVDFLPSSTSGKFKICIKGDTISDQVGTKDLGLLGCIYICSEGHTCLVSEAVLEYDGKRLSYGQLRSGAQTSTKIKGVDTPPLLRGPILNQIEKQKSKGEAEAAERARTKFVSQVRSQLDDAVGKANDRLKNGVRPTTKRLDFEPKRFEVTTSHDFMRILAIVGNSKHLSGLVGPMSSSKSDVVLQMHESTINNALQHMLGGRSVSNEDLRKLVTSFGIELPEPPADEKSLTITFPRVRPVQVSFHDGKITTTISANRIQQDQTLVRDKLQITVSYDLKSARNALQVFRSEDVAIKFEGAYTNAKSIVESNIKPKLEELFKKEVKEISLDELELPAELKNIGLPNITKLNLKDGWFHIELNMNDDKVASVPIKKLSQVPVIDQSKGQVQIKPLRTTQVSTAYISDSSTRISDNLKRTNVATASHYQKELVKTAFE